MEIPDTIEQIEEIFYSIVAKNSEIKNSLDDMVAKRDALLVLYRQLQDDNEGIVMALDIFNFQIKLLGNDIDFLTNKYMLTNNRMYCQYYKLFVAITEFVQSCDIPVRFGGMGGGSGGGGSGGGGSGGGGSGGGGDEEFPVYDDMAPNKAYEFKTVCGIHETTCGLIKAVLENLRVRNNKLKKYKQINTSGIHINVFVDTFRHNLAVIVDKITLFMETLKFYNDTNHAHYMQLLQYIGFIQVHVSEDIAFKELTTFVKPPSMPVVHDPSRRASSSSTVAEADAPQPRASLTHVQALSHYFDSIEQSEHAG